MAKIAILTDSTANLSPEWIEQYDIQVIPLRLNWGDESFRDGVDLTSAEFYQRLAGSKILPTTSQPPIQEFLAAFTSLVGQVEGIIVPLISAGISGTVSAAQVAAQAVCEEFPQLQIAIIDTRLTSIAQALVILAAGRAIGEGKPFQQVVQETEAVRDRLGFFFAVDTLEYLHRGGRINGAARLLGVTLNIKPILFMDHGKIEALESVRTRRKSLQRLIDLAVEKAAGRPAYVCIGHANSPEIAQEFRAEAARRLDCKEIYTSELSPVIASHVGPGTITIALYTEA